MSTHVRAFALRSLEIATLGTDSKTCAFARFFQNTLGFALRLVNDSRSFETGFCRNAFPGFLNGLPMFGQLQAGVQGGFHVIDLLQALLPVAHQNLAERVQISGFYHPFEVVDT
jgi:hypothetical protein